MAKSQRPILIVTYPVNISLRIYYQSVPVTCCDLNSLFVEWDSPWNGDQLLGDAKPGILATTPPIEFSFVGRNNSEVAACSDLRTDLGLELFDEEWNGLTLLFAVA